MDDAVAVVAGEELKARVLLLLLLLLNKGDVDVDFDATGGKKDCESAGDCCDDDAEKSSNRFSF